MKITIRVWSPKNDGSLKRWYVKDASAQTDIGYIQTRYKLIGYGGGYYARHRAAKGDLGEWTPQGYTLHGNEPILAALLEYARSGQRTGCGPENATATDNELGLLSQNADVYFWEKGAARRAKVKAQKTLTVDLAVSA